MNDCYIPPDATRDLRAQLESLCACKQASQQLQQALENIESVTNKNTEISRKYADDTAEYRRRLNLWNNREDEWLFKKQLDGTSSFFTKACFGRPGGCLGDAPRTATTDETCRREAREGGGNNAVFADYFETTSADEPWRTRNNFCSGNGWDGCAGQSMQSVLCHLPPHVINNFNTRYNESRPKEPPPPTYMDVPSLSGISVQCCSNYMNLAGTSANKDIAQSCQQTIENKIQSLLNPSTTPISEEESSTVPDSVPNTVPVTGPVTTPDKSVEGPTSIGNALSFGPSVTPEVLIGIIIAIVLLACLSIVGAAF